MSNDPFLKLYGDIQEVWNDKKGLDWSDKRARGQIIKRLEKFADSFPERQAKLKKEIEYLKEDYV